MKVIVRILPKKIFSLYFYLTMQSSTTTGMAGDVTNGFQYLAWTCNTYILLLNSVATGKADRSNRWMNGGVGAGNQGDIKWESRHLPTLPFVLQLPSNMRPEWKWQTDAAAFYEWNWKKERSHSGEGKECTDACMRAHTNTHILSLAAVASFPTSQCGK